MGRARVAAVVAFLVSALLVPACGDHRATEFIVSQPAEPGISVSGHGSVTAVPDIAVLTLGVEVTAPTVAVARSKAAAAMQAVRASLDGNGVARDDIKTISFNIQPHYAFPRDEKPEITGYTVSNLLSVKLRDLDAISDALDDAARAGGDAVRVNGIAFSVDDPKPYEAGARKAAVADARMRAEELATLSGVKLGRVLSISESGVSIPYQERGFGGMMLRSAAEAPTPISPGETDISLSVSVVYRIE